MRKITDKKGQMTLEDAPSIVLVVGLVFLVMATIALVGEKYGDSLLTDTTTTVVNESVTLNITGVGTILELNAFEFKSWNATLVMNRTVGAEGLGDNATLVEGVDYSIDRSLGTITNITSDWNTTAITFSYTHSDATIAYNATGDLQTEISNNTSIAGIVLTISLIGIVLTILIGVFLGITRRSGRI